MMRAARRLLDAVLEMLYPQHANCMGCGTVLGAQEGWLCGPCAALLEDLELQAEQLCPRCASPLGADGFCFDCEAWPKDGLDGAMSAFLYARPLRGVIWQMKYHSVYRLCDDLAEDLLSAFSQQSWPRMDWVLPVPMHAERLRERGYNQAALMARSFSRMSGIRYSDALVKNRHTPQQARLSMQQRLVELEGAFSVRGEVSGNVLLIDDVLTTGGTMNHCAQALKRAGAAKVYGLTVARSAHPRENPDA